MERYELVVRSQAVVLPGGMQPAAVCVDGGRIVAVAAPDAPVAGAQEVDVRDDVVLPGLVDTHVHVNEPGRTHWEGFATATRAAAAGGVTTIIDMPLNSVPPTVTVEALAQKRRAAEGRCFVDVGFWGGAVPGNIVHLRPLHDAGVFGFKAFLVHSGVDEFPRCGPTELEAALEQLAAFDALMVVHAEDSEAIERAPACHGGRYRDFLASRPRDAENAAVERLIELSSQTGGRIHVLHLSSGDALPALAAARAEGVPITAETCPHYLCLVAEEVPDGATEFKCCPPIREASNREVLWRGLTEGSVDCIVSDHSPSTPELKRFDLGDFGLAWGGISSLQLGLSAVWTEAGRRGHTLVDVARWMAAEPARIAGVVGKGAIAEGYDADLVAFAADQTFTVDPTTLHHRHPVTPYAGRTLTGVVRRTWLRGVEVGDGAEARPTGRLLKRGAR